MYQVYESSWHMIFARDEEVIDKQVKFLGTDLNHISRTVGDYVEIFEDEGWSLVHIQVIALQTWGSD